MYGPPRSNGRIALAITAFLADAPPGNAGRKPAAIGRPRLKTDLTAAERADLLVFLKSIDGATPRFLSEGDDSRDALRTAGGSRDHLVLRRGPQTSSATSC
jgi:hypothetical protein